MQHQSLSVTRLVQQYCSLNQSTSLSAEHFNLAQNSSSKAYGKPPVFQPWVPAAVETCLLCFQATRPARMYGKAYSLYVHTRAAVHRDCTEAHRQSNPICGLLNMLPRYLNKPPQFLPLIHILLHAHTQRSRTRSACARHAACLSTGPARHDGAQLHPCPEHAHEHAH